MKKHVQFVGRCGVVLAALCAAIVVFTPVGAWAAGTNDTVGRAEVNDAISAKNYSQAIDLATNILADAEFTGPDRLLVMNRLYAAYVATKNPAAESVRTEFLAGAAALLPSADWSTPAICSKYSNLLQQSVAQLMSRGDVTNAAQQLVNYIGRAPNLTFLRAHRGALNRAAAVISRRIAASNGIPLAGSNSLVYAQALIDAENTGQGLSNAIAGLQLTVPADLASNITAAAADRDAVLAGILDPNQIIAARIEWFLGVNAAKDYEDRYNGTK